MSISMPVSSWISRMAAAGPVSFQRGWPFGKPQRSGPPCLPLVSSRRICSCSPKTTPPKDWSSTSASC
eukprot:2894716-Alexandrium_andersonii.AAC.1